MENTTEDIHGRAVIVVEDQGVPGFLDVPKEEEHDIWPGLIREGKPQLRDQGTRCCPGKGMWPRRSQTS